MGICTRFPPSPTGYLHVGGARTALYSWLYARQHEGQFVLRIEDTDRERSTQEAVDAILEGMQWLGLDYDQGPFYQTQRLERYQECIQQLLDQGKAYKCYCSKERLDALREQQMANKEKPRYDGLCRDGAEQQGDYVIRFKNPTSGTVTWQDAVKGEISIANTELDDLIIARSDGMPTYNLTVVVDDWDMKITHVIRGDDHINNTPRQINLLQALGAPLPEYAHIPMILGEDGKRLSKRHGAVSVMAYREMGYLPQALLNYLVRLGWSHGDQEIFSREEMIQHFSLGNVSQSPAAFNMSKLNWVNQHYLKHSPFTEIEAEVHWHFQRAGVNLQNGPDIALVLPVVAERANTLVELVAQTQYFYQDDIQFDQQAAKKHLRPVALEPMQVLFDKLSALNEWHAEKIHHEVQATAESLDIGMGKVGMPMRVAITGGGSSPAIDITAEWIGRDRVLSRLQQAITFIAQRAGE